MNLIRTMAVVVVVGAAGQARAQGGYAPEFGDGFLVLAISGIAMDVALTAASITTGAGSTHALLKGNRESPWHRAAFIFGCLQAGLGATALGLAIENKRDPAWWGLAAAQSSLAAWNLTTSLIAKLGGPTVPFNATVLRGRASGRPWTGVGVQLSL